MSMATTQQKISNGVKIIKAILVSLLFVPLFVFILSPVEGFAQNQATLPNAGLTPESNFYFIDKLGEALREFFTFNLEGKARLQITFAAERVAEIKVILETKGIDAKGIEVAQARLQEHLGDATEIIVKQKGKGKDVSKLAKELDDKLEAPKSALADSFKAEKRELEAKEDALKAQLKAAHRAGDTAKAEALAQELGQVKAQLELLELKEEDIEDELEAEEEKLEEEIEVQQKAEKAIREVEEEKQEIIDEAVEEGIELPANAFAEFDGFLAEAKRNLEEGDFVKAKQFAKQAEKSLDKLEKTIEELEKNQEKKEEAEEAIKEAEEEKQEVLSEARKEGVEASPTAFAKFDRLLAQAKELFTKENYQGAKQLAEQAENVLEDVDKEIKKLEKERENKEEQADKQQEDELKEETKKLEEAKQPTAPKTYNITLTQDQLKLQGVWKDLATGNHASFKFYRFTWQGNAGSGEWCQEVIVSGSTMVCNGYTVFTLSGNNISGDNFDDFQFTLSDGRLTLAFGDGKAGGNQIYTKTTLPLPPFKGVIEN